MAERALIAGATGLIGRALLGELLRKPGYERVRVVGRRRLELAHPRLEQHVLDLERLAGHTRQRESFDGTPAKQQRETRPASTTSSKDPALVCARCGFRITHPAEAIEVDANHEHTFLNPAGVVYFIRCFGSAPGCLGVGPWSDEWTWFEGHRWRIQVCGECREHLGWSFEAAMSSFFGLITAKLHE